MTISFGKKLTNIQLNNNMLATALKEGTKKSHTMAENTGFISCFLKGVVDKSSYRNFTIASLPTKPSGNPSVFR